MLLERLPTPVLLVRKSDGVVIFANEAAAHCLGSTSGGLADLPFSALFDAPPQYPEPDGGVPIQPRGRDGRGLGGRLSDLPAPLDHLRLVILGPDPPAEGTGHPQEPSLIAAELAERLKELDCLNRINAALQRPDLSTAEALQRVADALPQGFRYPNEAVACVSLGDGQRYCSDAAVDRMEHSLSRPLRSDDRELGHIVVGYPTNLASGESDPFLAEEGDLLDMVAARVVALLERQDYEKSLRQAAHVFASAREGVIITDPDRRIISVNTAFTRITGYSEAEVLGKTPAILSSGYHDEAFYEAIWRNIEAQGHWQGEIWNRRKGGELYPQWLSITAIHDDDGGLINYAAVFSDLSRIKQTEAELEHLAHYDPLTGLPNRTLLSSLLDERLAGSRQRGDRLAVLLCDVARLKDINDSLGYQAGDQVLQGIAERLGQRVRSEDLLARHGGDEFVVVMEHLHSDADAGHLAQALIERAAAPLTLSSGQQASFGMSVGIALFPDHGETAAALLQAAEAAMYDSKARGRGDYVYYRPGLTRTAQRRLEMDIGLREALDAGELAVHFQPLLAVADRRVIGAEALARWARPDGAAIPPEEFIPAAEDSGLILALGEYVLDHACAAAAEWHARGHRETRIAVNLSAAQFRDPRLVDKVAERLRMYGLPARALEVELTERLLVSPDAGTREAIAALKDLGVSLAIDDFGTGYSALAYLQDLEADTIKIDRRFIRNLPADTRNARLTATVIAMGNALGLEVLAEGVETEDQLAFLQREGCLLFQGFLAAPAIPAPDFLRLLEDAGAPP